MNDDELLFIAQKFKTPLYLINANQLHERVAYLRKSLPEGVKLCYAVKANTFVIPLLEDRVERFEICSPGEAHICRNLGIAPETMVISGVHKDEATMRTLLTQPRRCCRFTIESRAQFELIERLAREFDLSVPVLLRRSSGNQFGMDDCDIERIVSNRAAWPHIELRGIQFFSGTQITSTKRLSREIKSIKTLFNLLEQNYGFTVDELEYGPGLPVDYFSGTLANEEPAHLAALSNMLDQLHFGGQLVLEIGRSITASSATYLTSAVDLKRVNSANFALVDGGKHQITYFGAGAGLRNPPCRLLTSDTTDLSSKTASQSPWNLCGSLCTTSDVLAKQLALPPLKVGDVFAFDQAGAYCMTEGMSLFLSRDLPKILIAHGDGSISLAREALDTHPINSPVI